MLSAYSHNWLASGVAFSTPELAASNGQHAVDREKEPVHRRRGWRAAALAAFFVALTLAMVRPDPSVLAHSVPNNDGDSALIVWTLAWGWHALVTDPIHYFDGNIFWPARDTLVFSDTVGPLSPFYALLHGLTASWTVALDVLALGLIVLSLTGAYLLCRHLTGSTGAALVGAAAFAFSGYATSQFGHVQLESLGLLPLSFWLLFLTLERGRWWLGVLLGVASACVGLCAEYDGLAYGASIVAIVGLWLVWRGFRPGWAQARSLLLAGVVAVALLAPSTSQYLYVARHYHFHRPYQSAGLVWRDLINPATFSYVWSNTPIVHPFGAIEGHLYPGVTVLALAVVGVGALAVSAFRRGGRAREASDRATPATKAEEIVGIVAAGAVCLVLSFGDSTGRLWSVLYDHVPAFAGIRVPSRLAVVTILAVDVLGALGVASLLRRLASRPKQVAVTVVVLALVLTDLAIPFKWGPMPQDRSVLAAPRALRLLPPGPVAEVPMTSDPYVNAPEMVYSTLNWDPILNGYSGYAPPDYPAVSNEVNTFPSSKSLQVLRNLRVRYVVITMPFGGQEVGWTPAQVAAALRRLPPGACATREGADELVVLPGTGCPRWLQPPARAARALATLHATPATQ